MQELTLLIISTILSILVLYKIARNDVKEQKIPAKYLLLLLIAGSPAALIGWYSATWITIILIAAIAAVLTLLTLYSAIGGGDYYLYLALCIIYPNQAIAIILASFLINTLMQPVILWHKNKPYQNEDLTLRLTYLASPTEHKGKQTIKWEVYYLPAAVGIIYAVVIIQLITLIPQLL